MPRTEPKIVAIAGTDAIKRGMAIIGYEYRMIGLTSESSVDNGMLRISVTTNAMRDMQTRRVKGEGSITGVRH